jgi:hypothetical protein
LFSANFLSPRLGDIMIGAQIRMMRELATAKVTWVPACGRRETSPIVN